MTSVRAQAWCLAQGVTVVPPGTRPYYLVWKRAPGDPPTADYAVGELLAEAVLAFQDGRTRHMELRRIAPEACHCSGGEPCPKA